MKMRLVHKGLILVGVPLLLAVLVASSMFVLLRQTDKLRLEDARQRHVADNVCTSLVKLQDAVLCFESILLRGAITSVPKGGLLPQSPHELKLRLRQDIKELGEIHDEINRLDPNVVGAKRQMDFDNLLQDTLGAFTNLASTVKGHGLGLDSLAMISHMRKDITERTFGMSTEARDISLASLSFIENSPARQRSVFHFELGVLIAGVISSIVSGLLLARWFMSDVTMRLQVVSDNTLRMSRGDALNPPMPGSDEIATLDRGFHSMATALRQAIAKEHALFENASDIMCVLDRRFRVTAVNPACQRILGFAPEEMIGGKLIDFVVPENRDTTVTCLEGTKTGNPATTFESSLRHKSGADLDSRWSVYWSEMDESIYAVAHDISERKQIERMKEQFLSMVSHDLRSPLSSIFGTFKLIIAGAFGPLPAPVADRINGVIANVNRLLGLVNDLLDIEKLEAGKLELQRQNTRIAELLQQAVSEIQPIAAEKELTIDLQCEEFEFAVDGDRLMQVLLNLLSNAVKYSPRGSTVSIVAVVANERLKVTVRDHGRGIPEAARTSIFERFKQVHAADVRTGTGLGLPICKLIVEAHGGSIGVDSTPGQGSVFWFELPAQAARLSSESTGSGTAYGASASANRVSATMAVVAPTAAPISLPVAKESGRIYGEKSTAVSKPVVRKAARRQFSFSNLSLLKKGVILVVVPVIFELLLCGGLFVLLTNAFNEQQAELHQRLVATNATDLLLEYYVLGFSMNLKPPERSWREFEIALHNGERAKSRLLALTANDPRLSSIFRRLGAMFDQVQSFGKHSELVVKQFGVVSDDALQAAYGGRDGLLALATQVTPVLQELTDRANQLAEASPVKLDALRHQQGLVLLGGLAVSLLLSGLSAYLFSSGIAQRLRVTEQNVKRLERDQPLLDPLEGRDEVAHLDQVFHSMASALNEARHKERAVFDNSQHVICTISADGNIARINPAGEWAWGYSPVQAVGKSVLAVTAPDAVAMARENLLKAAREKSPREFESQIVRRDGSLCDILWSLAWSAEEDALVAIAHDISQRKELERLKQEFLSMVSHDMRTPLSSISVTTEMLAAGALGELPPKANQQLQVVVRNCDRLLALINDLLDIDKLESGQMQLTMQMVDAADVWQRSVESLAHFADQKGVKVTVEVLPGLTVEADSDRLVQVGVNLLSNAVKFSQPGGSVRLTAVGNGQFVEFAAEDSGRGIPESQLQAIFQRFRQVETADGMRSAGTGLGLPICKQIVERHGGEIGVSSQVGRGSRFFFRIPLRQLQSKTPPVEPGVAQAEGR